jgi:hypothetical protein
MTLPEALTLASSIGSFAAGLAALFTVLEMRRQYRITTGATIVIHSVSLSFFKPHPFSLASPGVLTRELPENPMSLGTDVYLDCINLGPGLAKAISYEWAFDVDEAIALIARIDGDSRYEIWHDKQGSFESVKSGFKGRETSVHNLNTQLRGTGGFLRPSEGVGLRLRVPDVYIELYEIFLGVVAVEMLAVTTLMEKTPEALSLMLTVSYLDIGNRQTKRKFSVQPHLMRWAPTGLQTAVDSEKPVLSAHVTLQVNEM